MEKVIRDFIRAISVFIAFAVIIDIPNYLYTLYLLHSAGKILSLGGIMVLMPIFYPIVIAYITWITAPYLSHVISNKYKNDTRLNINAMVLVGLLIIGTKYVLERIILVANYWYDSSALLRNSIPEHVIVKGEYSWAKLLGGPVVTSTLVTLIIIAICAINYRKLEKAIVAHIK